MPIRSDDNALRLRITLRGVDPPVWRQLLVPGHIDLGTLHLVFQAAMGWTNSHLHCFTAAGARFGPADDEDFDEDAEVDETTVSVLEALGTLSAFSYEYDFGDSWEHHIEVEEVIPSDARLKVATCLAGANACPPEDCGGPLRYEELLRALADPSHEEHRDLVDWIGPSFDPAAFDLVAVNATLQRVR